MTASELLLAATLAVPLAMLAACLSRVLRAHMPALLWVAPLPALATASFAAQDTTVVLPRALFGLTLMLDRPGAVLLGTASLLWIGAALSVRRNPRGAAASSRFAAWWLATLAGCFGVFIAADIAGFYLFFTLVSLAAYGLIAHDDTASARRAGAVYVAFALVGEALLLTGFVLLAAASPRGSLLIRDAVAALPASPWREWAIAFLVAGFGLKIGLVPLHAWMPLAYAAAPSPAAAVLSGAAAKVGVIGLIRVLPFDAALPDAGHALAVVGLISTFYGVAIGLTQSNAASVLAYSSVSQMGFLAVVLGTGLAAGDASTALAAAFYALRHMLVKGSLFLAIGVMAFCGARQRWLVLLPAAVLALGLGGLPLTGGALAKFIAKIPFGDGIASAFAIPSAIATTLLMLHFLRCLALRAPRETAAWAPRMLMLTWLVMAVTSAVAPSVLALANVPWDDVLTLRMFWEALWPVAIGALLALAFRRQQVRLPRIPAGDILALGTYATPALRTLGLATDMIEARLRAWPVAGALLLAVAIVLAGAAALSSP